MRYQLLVLMALALIFQGCWGASDKDPHSGDPSTRATARATASANPTAGPLPQLQIGPKDGNAFKNSLSLLMVWIPPGRFSMGQGTNHSSEKPVHEVKIKKGFWMGATEITQEQYEQVAKSNPSRQKGQNHPVESVSFFEAQKFCEELTKQEQDLGLIDKSFHYGIPSEAQWEYACVAGTRHKTYGLPVNEVAWHRKNAQGKHHPVGEKRPNPWGLYDILGNVSEWCACHWHENYVGAPQNDSVWKEKAKSQNRIGRGGDFNKLPHFSCSYMRRFHNKPEDKPADRGMRIVLLRK